MKVKAYSSEIEPIVRLKLVEDSSGVNVVAVDGSGSVISYLFCISEEGLYISTGVASKLGFPLDGKHRIKVIED